MGYRARFTGEITISPPLTWPELGKQSLQNDLRIELRQEVTDTDTGQVTVITGVAVKAASPSSGYKMLDELQALLGVYGGTHQFTGHIEAVGEEGDRWRLLVRDGKAVQVYPQIIWPGEDAAEVTRRFGELDRSGRPVGDGHNLWHTAIWIPEGREAKVAGFLDENGIGVYRMWREGQ